MDVRIEIAQCVFGVDGSHVRSEERDVCDFACVGGGVTGALFFVIFLS